MGVRTLNYFLRMTLVGVTVQRLIEGMIHISSEPLPTIPGYHSFNFFWRMVATRLKVSFLTYFLGDWLLYVTYVING
jgi:hypothetical protein